jgi:hypothetical protein
MKQFYYFLSLFGFYLLIIILFSREGLFGDEYRYVQYAENFAMGFITDPQNPMFFNGILYSVIITPFIALDLPYLYARLPNALLMTLAVFMLHKTLRVYATQKLALVLTLIFAFNFSIIRYLTEIYTEMFVLVLICGFMYFVIKYIKEQSGFWPNGFLATLFLGLLLLTKFIFVYVVLGTLIAGAIYYLWSKRREIMKFSLVLSISFLFIVPYVLYTYSMTGKMFHLTNMSGEALYWMSSRYENEYGTWFSPDIVAGGFVEGMHPEHITFFQSFQDKTYEERDEIIMERAKENLKKNPKNYLLNVLFNPARFVFDYPESYASHTPGIYDNMLFFYTLIIIPFLMCVYPIWQNKTALRSL